MTEIELKLQVPADAQRAVDAAVGTGRARRTRLRAVYYDTADRRLAAAGIALRVRQEGRVRVQTVKAAGNGLLERLEHNVALSGASRDAGPAPAVDPARHAGTEAGARLAAALAPRDGETDVPLQAVYRTDILRHHRTLRTTGGVVELAYDTGAILAGDRRMAVSELEIELVRGRPEAVVDVARRWAARHGLWIDLRTKAERGERLARGQDQAPAVKAAPIALAAHATVDDAARSVLSSCLMQVLANAGEIAGARHGADHVHQMRVGLRRLRTALRLFDGWATGIDPAWTQEIAVMFRQLGGQRDRDALEATLLPRLREAGAPFTDPFGAEDPDAADAPVRVARSAAFTDLALRLQRFVSGGESGGESGGGADGGSADASADGSAAGSTDESAGGSADGSASAAQEAL
ncbi:MAG TPA: CYTH domain-containing protein, partial [Quisquiliibacterium sp.]|nr:CYTH domain-containing protein [Quisquiliibacterium sp.]